MIEKLDDLMSRVKLYQDPDLHLDGLADSMGGSTRSLSALINGHYEQNFYDFVNDYRVRDAQRQLEDPRLKSKTIQRIFEDAGFNSKSTFNTYFKKVTGKTPSQYRKAAHSEFDVYLGGSAQ
jgi:AraC-like DNA-binding protein